MTNYLDPIKPPFKPKARFQPRDNFEELQNEGHKEVTEDFEDSPFADRTPVEENE